MQLFIIHDAAKANQETFKAESLTQHIVFSISLDSSLPRKIPPSDTDG
jgi:hypothetical protein